jgi:hypothetical protein
MKNPYDIYGVKTTNVEAWEQGYAAGLSHQDAEIKRLKKFQTEATAILVRRELRISMLEEEQLRLETALINMMDKSE